MHHNLREDVSTSTVDDVMEAITISKNNYLSIIIFDYRTVDR